MVHSEAALEKGYVSLISKFKDLITGTWEMDREAPYCRTNKTVERRP